MNRYNGEKPYLQEQSSFIKGVRMRENKLNIFETLKLRKKQIIHKIQQTQPSNSYLQYLLSNRNSFPSQQQQYQQHQHQQQTARLLMSRQQQSISGQFAQMRDKKLSHTNRRSSKLSSLGLKGANGSNASHDNISDLIGRSKVIKQQKSGMKRKMRLPKISKQHTSLKKISIQKQSKESKQKRKKLNKSHKIIQPQTTNNNILQTLIKTINKKPNKRNANLILSMKAYLQQNNELFSKLPQNLILYLLQVSTYHRYSHGSPIYYTKDNRQQLFILLEGVIHYWNPVLHTKKLGLVGKYLGRRWYLGVYVQQSL